MSLYFMLKDSAQKYPNNIALIEKDKRVSYKELLNRVDELCSILNKMNIKKGVTVGLALHNSIEFVVHLYAFSKNENIIFLLDPNWNNEEIYRKINSASVNVLVAESYVIKRLKKNSFDFTSRCKIIKKISEQTNLNDSILENMCPCNIESDNYGFELIQSTSGTTNLAKLGYRSEENLEIDSKNIVEELGYSDNDKIFISIPMCHGYALTMGVIAGIRSGALLYIQRWFAYKDFESKNREENFSVILGIPEIFDCINVEAKENGIDVSSARWIFSSGDRIEESTIRLFHELTGKWISQVYGMMEVSTISINKLAEEDSILSVGNVFPGLELRLGPMNKAGLSEILVRGKTVSEKYICDNEMFSVTDKEGWFHTKDLGYIENGLLYLKGRKKTIYDRR